MTRGDASNVIAVCQCCGASIQERIAEAEEAARVEEREACAAFVEQYPVRTGGWDDYTHIARHLRARTCTDDRCAIHGSGTMSEGSRCPTGDAARRATRRKEGRDG